MAFCINLFKTCIGVGKLVELFPEILLDKSGYKTTFEPKAWRVGPFWCCINGSEALSIQIRRNARILRLGFIWVVVLYLSNKIADNGLIFLESFLGFAVNGFKLEASNWKIAVC